MPEESNLDGQLKEGYMGPELRLSVCKPPQAFSFGMSPFHPVHLTAFLVRDWGGHLKLLSFFFLVVLLAWGVSG